MTIMDNSLMIEVPLGEELLERVGGKEDHDGLQVDTQHSIISNREAHAHGTYSFRTALPQILAVSAKNIVLLTYGMTLGFPTIVIPAIQEGGGDTLSLTKEQISWFSSINLICVPVGCMASGLFTGRLGRKRSMLLVNFPFLAAWIIFHFAHNVAMLYTCLVLTGLGGGLLEAPVLTYVAEITQPQLRGALSATSSTSVILGIFLQFLMGGYLNWRTIAAINIFFPVAGFIALCFVPESPYWLVGKDRLAEAERSLCWLRGWVQPAAVHAEFNDLVASLTSHPKSPRPATTWRHYTHRTFLRPYFLVSSAFFIGHFGGVITLQTFAVSIFSDLGSPIDEFLATLYLGLAQLAGCIICVTMVHWTGKRPLSFISAIGGGSCFIAVATYSYLHPDAADSDNGWLPTYLLIFTAFFFNIGIRPLPWILIGEVYPGRVRNIAAGASGSIGYIFGFLVNKSYLYMLDGMTMAGTFWFYGAVNLLGCGFLYWYLPETEGRTLAEIERHFDGEEDLLKGRYCCQNCDVSVKKRVAEETAETRF